MSHYMVCTTVFKDKQSLLDALCMNGFKKEQIEVHEKATNLYGFQGDMREQVANIVIRRKHVGGASNDLGFVRNADGTYSSIISEYDAHRYNAEWMGKLTQSYNLKVTTKQAVSQGMPIKITNKADGNIRLVIQAG